MSLALALAPARRAACAAGAAALRAAPAGAALLAAARGIRSSGPLYEVKHEGAGASAIDDYGARVDGMASNAKAADAAAAAAGRAGFEVPRSGAGSAEAPSPGAAAGMGVGMDWMRGMIDIVAGAAQSDKGRVAKGVQEMERESATVHPLKPGSWRPQTRGTIRREDED